MITVDEMKSVNEISYMYMVWYMNDEGSLRQGTSNLDVGDKTINEATNGRTHIIKALLQQVELSY